MIQAKQYKMRDEDIKLLILPKLGDDILEKILKTKKKYNQLILISLIFCKFGLNLTKKLSEAQQNTTPSRDSDNSLLFQWTSYFIGNVFMQIMIGFMTDLVSVQVSWAFTTVISVIGMLIQISYFFTDNNQMFMIGQVVISCAFVSNYVCGSYILFNTSYELIQRFNYASMFVVFGTFSSNFISFILTRCINISKNSILIFIFICLAIVLVGGLIIYYLYKKIEDIKKLSGDYQKFLRYQGVGLNLKSIGYYYFNKNFFFLGILSFFGNLAGPSTPQNFQDILKSNDANTGQHEAFVNSIEISQTVGILLIFQFLMNYINNEKKFITMWYKSQVLFLKILFALNLINSFVFYYSLKLPFILLFLIFLITSLFQGISSLYCKTICYQINYCLSDEKCSIKCIGLGILGFFQDLPSTLFMTPMEIIINQVIQTLIVFLTTIQSLYFLKNRSFEKLEQVVLLQYKVKDNIEKQQQEISLEKLL